MRHCVSYGRGGGGKFLRRNFTYESCYLSRLAGEASSRCNTLVSFDTCVNLIILTATGCSNNDDDDDDDDELLFILRFNCLN